MIDYKLKGILNQHSLVKNDESNIANGNNNQVYSQIIQGHQKSEMFDYLLNLNHQRLSDFKSIMYYNKNNIAALQNEAQLENEIVSASEVIQLPTNLKPIKEKLGQILEKRQSIRTYNQKFLDLSTFSGILKFSFGTSKRTIKYGDTVVSTRAYASGGGLYPVKIILYINNIESIQEGFYLYQPINHSLLRIGYPDNDVRRFFVGQGLDIENFHFIVCYTYSVNQTYLKYGELSLLNVIAEAGIVAHNFDLVATSYGEGTCIVAGFNKYYLESQLDFDHVNEHVLLTSICGGR